MTSTRDAEELRATFARFYGRPVIDFTGRDRSFHAVIDHCRLQHIELNYGTYGGNLQFSLPESAFISQVFALRGSCEVVIEGRSVNVDHEGSLLISAGVPLDAKSDADYERLTLCIRPQSLIDALARLTGKDIAGPITMAPTQNVSAVPGRLLRDQVMFLAAQLNAGRPVHALAVTEFEHALMATFLRTNRHNYSHLLEREPLDTGLALVRRTEDYIAAHWRDAITLDDLARIGGTSALALCRSFKSHRGYSPQDFLRRMRMLQPPPAG